jgi:release factor glutamine methyltransferase
MLARSFDHEGLGASTEVLDLCTGSGFLAIQAALRGAESVWAVDISRRAVLAAHLNGRLNGVHVRARRGDLFGPVAGRRFDLVVSNPPYLPGPASAVGRTGPSRAWEAGPRGRLFIDRICASVGDHLRPGGRVLLVHSSLCDPERTLSDLRAQGLRARIVARYPGPLGPILTARADWLRAQGLLAGPENREDIVIVRGERPSVSARTRGSRPQRRPATPAQPG